MPSLTSGSAFRTSTKRTQESCHTRGHKVQYQRLVAQMSCQSMMIRTVKKSLQNTQKYADSCVWFAKMFACKGTFSCTLTRPP
jgi:hypothetical protein